MESDIILQGIGKVNDEIRDVIEQFNNSLAPGRIDTGKIMIHFKNCYRKDCRWCPHGPYWAMAEYDTKKGKYRIIHLGKHLLRTHLSRADKKKWEQFQVFDSALDRLREKKKKLIKQYKKTNNEYKPISQKVICPHCKKLIEV